MRVAKIGIFWLYQQTVIGRAVELSAGVENVPGILDSADNHLELWEHDPDFVKTFHELIDTEYQQIPRGRVLFSTKNKKAIVYMDRKLHTQEAKQLISQFFSLELLSTYWEIDEHYTTDSFLLDDLFD